VTDICAIIFSKDRGLQLKCCLDSFFFNCKDDVDVIVIYTNSNEKFGIGYNKIISEYGHKVKLILERNFREDLLTELSKYKYCLFVVDDTVFTRDFSLLHIKNILIDASVFGFSLRLGKNTTYCYPLGKKQRMPDFTEKDNVLCFIWYGADFDFGYPFEVSSSVYFVDFIYPILNTISFKDPNTLEDIVSSSINNFSSNKPYLMCYTTSVAFSNPLNKVQNICNNRSGTILTADYLNSRFIDGFCVNILDFQGFISNGCHQEVDINLYEYKR